MAGSSNKETMTRARQHKIAPWGTAPKMRSRLTGLGGTEAAKDSACVFETAPMAFEEGWVTISIEIAGFSGDLSIMFIDLTNSAIFEGSPRTRLQLIPVELHPGLEDVQRYQVKFTAYTNVVYRLSGYIHGDALIRAERLSIASDRPFTIPLYTKDSVPPQKCRRENLPRPDIKTTGRLYDLSMPDFEQLHSQPMTTNQLSHPAFARLQDDLFSNNASPAWTQWPEIFVMRAMETFGSLDKHGQGIGFDAAKGTLWSALLEKGHTVMLAERTFDPAVCFDLGELREELTARRPVARKASASFHHSLIGEALPPEYCGKFDFAWWIAETANDRRFALRGLLNVAESLNENGLGVAVLPVHFSQVSLLGSVSTKIDLPRILIDTLSLGHQIVQVRLPPVSKDVTGAVGFGFILHRPERKAEAEPTGSNAT